MAPPLARETLEIRLHGRGGQGGVTCAKILAALFARLGKSVQTFGDYAGERSGAPVRAYTRVSDRLITNRNKVYEPDHILVLDPTLLGGDVVLGLRPGGTLLLNTAEPLAAYEGRFTQFRLALVDATGIARRRKIGTRTVVIVNTTIAGAFARVFGIGDDVLRGAYADLGFSSNLDAAKEAFEAVVVREAAGVAPPPPAATPKAPKIEVVPLTEHVESPPTGLKTGSWRTQEPRYVEHLAPCSAFCPAGNDVIGFVRTMATGTAADAAAILARSTPLPGVCGHVCPAPCMEGCNRREYDGAIAIRGLERWIADHAPEPARVVAKVDAPKRLAVVGGGPAGLGAAYAWTLAGHRAVIFEGEKELGGVLRTGIPEFRLPRTVIDREVASLLSLGIEAKTGVFLDRERVRALATEYDALVLATGLQKLRKLDVPGEKLAGVEQGLHFLHRVNLGGGVRCAGHVVVLGGGNTAIDCARSALRAGASEVTVAYRRSRVEMPAIHEEIEEAEAEGVRFLMLRQPKAVVGTDRVQAIELSVVELGEPDASGRRSPQVTDRSETLPCDLVLLALGQSAETSLLPEGWKLEDGRIFDHGTPRNVFAAGDFSTGDGTVTHALGSGRRAAGLALAALGIETRVFERPDRATSVPATDIRFDHFAPAPPTPEVLVPPEVRKRSFALANHGLPNALEAHRCFSCGHCTHCDTCLVYCPEGIIRRKDADYAVDYSYCKGCGICAHECPRKALEMVPL